MRFGKQNARPGGYESNKRKREERKGANMVWEIMLSKTKAEELNKETVKVHANSFDEALAKARAMDKDACCGWMSNEEV